MPALLHIDCSPLPGASTRALAAHAVARWRQRHPDAALKVRDLGLQPIDHVGRAFAESVTCPPEAYTQEMRDAHRVHRALADEFLAADHYLLSMPMRILTVPSTFKAYVEHIFHAGVVFEVGASGYRGLLGGRKVLCITARGGDYRTGSPIASFDFLETYLRGLFTFCGVAPDDIRVVNVHATFGDPSAREAAIGRARTEVLDHVDGW